jgi:hypothetical protein
VRVAREQAGTLDLHRQVECGPGDQVLDVDVPAERSRRHRVQRGLARRGRPDQAEERRQREPDGAPTAGRQAAGEIVGNRAEQRHRARFLGIAGIGDEVRVR